MKCFKIVKNYFKRCLNEYKRTSFKLGMLVGFIFLLIGIFVWSFGKQSHKILSVYLFPKFALPLIIMYFIWAIIYLCVGFAVFSVLFNCEIYKKYFAQKISFLLCMSILFSYFSCCASSSFQKLE